LIKCQVIVEKSSDLKGGLPYKAVLSHLIKAVSPDDTFFASYGGDMGMYRTCELSKKFAILYRNSRTKEGTQVEKITVVDSDDFRIEFHISYDRLAKWFSDKVTEETFCPEYKENKAIARCVCACRSLESTESTKTLFVQGKDFDSELDERCKHVGTKIPTKI
jgi:hypothetical protein